MQLFCATRCMRRYYIKCNVNHPSFYRKREIVKFSVMLTISSRLMIERCECTLYKEACRHSKFESTRVPGGGRDADGTSLERFCISRWVFFKKRKIDELCWWNKFHAVVPGKCSKRFNDLKCLYMLFRRGKFPAWEKVALGREKNAFGFSENSVECLCQDKETRPARKMQILIAIWIFITKN